MWADFDGDPNALFQAMVRSQPQSYGALIDLGDRQVLSVSPESFFSRDDRVVTAKPMKGTGPRGRSSIEDLEKRDVLLRSEKERAGNPHGRRHVAQRSGPSGRDRIGRCPFPVRRRTESDGVADDIDDQGANA